MASASTKSASKGAPTPKQEEKKAARRPAVARVPAFAQAKLAVSRPGDAHEREADQVAAQVARAAKTPAEVQRASLEPGVTPQKREESLAPKAVPAAQEIQKKAAPPAGAGEGVFPLCRRGSEGDLSRAASADAPEIPPAPLLQRGGKPAEGMAGREVPASAEARIEAKRGAGAPLPETVLNEMQGRIGHDFSAVRIHTDKEAADLNTEMQARAFTVGSDVFFAPGEYAPGTDAGRELLAHELTHVVQQGGGVRRLSRLVDPAPSPMPASGSAADTALNNVSVLEIPPIKYRHLPLYTGAGARRAAGYARNTSQAQTTVWNNGISLTEAVIEQKLKAEDPAFVRPAAPSAPVNFKIGAQVYSTPWKSLHARLLIPDWDRRGTPLTTRGEKFQVDHMVELQVFGDTTGDAGNVIGNLELLKGTPNASSGSTIKGGVYAKVEAYLAASDPAFSALAAKTRQARVKQWLDTHSITFTTINRGAGQAGDDADWWTRTEIDEGAPLEDAQPAPAARLQGKPGEFVLASGAGGIEVARYNYDALQFQPKNERLRKAMAGVRISEFQLAAAVEAGNAGDPAGFMLATWNLPENFRAGEAVQIPLVTVGPYCASPGAIPALNTDFSHLSPVSLPQVEIRDGRLYAEGQLTPSIPLFAGHPIQVVLDGDDLRFSMEYAASQLSLPIPGIAVQDGSVALFYSTQEGFGGSGQVGLGMDKVGTGALAVEVSQNSGFSATGEFNFDPGLFDRASIQIHYRDGQFGGGGEIGIDTPGKVRGIQSANLAVQFQEGAFSASGEVQPSIPGVQQAGLTVAHSEAEGLVIGGNLQLAANPAIRSGSVDVTVKKVDDLWKVSAAGTAQPAIPGINSELRVSYDDGAFSAEASGEYGRGMLKGTANVGVTNRSLDDAGQPTGAPAPDAPLIVYGGGSASITFAPWLQGTAGMQFRPDGKVVVSGEIGLPSALTIFPRKELDKSLFSLATQIPIVPGIVAEVGGNLKAIAGIGPGQLDQLRIGVDHYEPEDESKTRITGDAHLNIPADAGLRLAARAGVGLGITGASATGGLELGGMAGIAGAAEAGVHIDWTPASGLAIDAEGYLHAEPKFKFDVSGYVAVTVAGFEVYGDTYEFAALELGSDLRLGVRFPIHYRDGQPFDVSLDDVQFEVPEVNTDALLDDLGAKIF
ncbi:MAG: DUF4157 domain-containing protein [Betaproteobacteria bacterium]|nr:DUF4157 domain-containing protein [Betaproteobacteria bacterium]